MAAPAAPQCSRRLKTRTGCRAGRPDDVRGQCSRPNKDVDGLLERAAGDAGFALIAVLRDLLQLPASRSNGGAAGESLATAAASVAAVHDGLHGETDLHAVQLRCALSAELRATKAPNWFAQLTS